jgi:hypothetical protein
MKFKFKGVFSTAVAIAFGALVLAGYLFGHTADGGLTLLGKLQLLLLNIAVILVGFAVLAGVFNLLQVHVNKIRRKQKGAVYSVILIVMLAVSFLLGFLARFLPAAETWFAGVFRYVQLPVEQSLMALMVVTLTIASIRLLRRNMNAVAITFLVTAFLVLLGMAPWPFLGDVPFLSDTVRPFIARIPASAGARGILIGVALGTLTTGLRILFGSDRPYGGKRG